MASLPDGVRFLPRFFDPAAQARLLGDIRRAIAAAPLFVPRMPRSGKPMSVRMTNCGELGWVTDKERGYRYQPLHPGTGNPWPPIPPLLFAIWRQVADYPAPPQACLVNYYDASARMGLHQDRDEKDFSAPVVSVSLGCDCRFRIGGAKRGDPATGLTLRSGDVLVLGGASRLAHHGVDRIVAGSSDLLAEGGRINLTLRRVDLPA
jgi:alkylated DNA repair protein (DNA oxidative demethylase)